MNLWYNQNRRIPVYALLSGLLAVYLGFRLFFKFIPDAKLAFIYPSGVFVNAFLSGGEYSMGEWLFGGDSKTVYILGESCSGTTFFSMLFAYMTYSVVKGYRWWWLLLVYPLSLMANTIRVISSIYAHQLIKGSAISIYAEYVHIACGVAAFLVTFILVVYILDHLNGRASNAAY
ncbi:archaeosortase/exosortase family protein [Teredinibacter franksiae]|uniref:archaeosortase/exosortase family protein n=1 Tax=Teredinibacter franksiae TaxID=2761453 RepID=UPI001624024D|nr:archaeosortase/exosortase family protein [Teredinibacter franksiae]